jgi:hypothetical protein
MRYQIRTGEGTEFEVPDGAFLLMLLRQRFLDADDEIRKVGQARWRRLGDIPEYREVLREVRSSRIDVKSILLVAFLLGCIVMILAILYRLGTTSPSL